MTRWNVRAQIAQAGALLAVIFAAMAAPAAAEVRVTDAGGGRLVIEAQDATVQQILEALAETRPIRFQPSDALARHVTGTYAGTLPRVLSRILAGYDHVIRSTQSGLQIDVVGAAQSTKFTGAVANSVTISAMAHRAGGVSSNVDLDEEPVQTKTAAGPLTVNLASGPRVSAPPVQPARATPSGNGQPRMPHTSSNVDLDEETSH